MGAGWTTWSSRVHDKANASVYHLHRWGQTNRELVLRCTAHGVVLVAITATLGLSHVRLADIRLPALSAPAATANLVRIADDAPPATDSETFLQRAVIPRTASAIRISAVATDVIEPAPRDDLFMPPSRVREVARPADPASVAPSLDSLIKPYTVEDGDTLSGIATKFGVSLEALVSANPDLGNSLETIFHPGDEFTIPPPGGILHFVQDGDTLESIAAKYQVTVQDIVSYAPNRLKSDSQLQASQRVFVPEGQLELTQPKPRTNTLASVLQPRTTTNTTTTATTARTTTATTTTAKPATTTAAKPAVPAPAQAPAASAAPTWGTGSLRTPLYGYMITQQFWAYHNGVDLAAPIGTPVYAADAGRVVWSGWDNTGYGYMVLIDHGNGFRTRYGHLSWIFPSYGDYVQKGEQIGKVGSTGRSTGPHLHFEVIVNGIARNPFNYIR